MSLMRAKLLLQSPSTAMSTLRSIGACWWTGQRMSTHLCRPLSTYHVETQYRSHHVTCLPSAVNSYLSLLQRQRQLQWQLCRRWRHGAGSKLGHMKETLDELAHRPEREAAQERRQKKKEKAAAKKSNSNNNSNNNKKAKGGGVNSKNNETPSPRTAAHSIDGDEDGNLDFLKDADSDFADHDDDDDNYDDEDDDDDDDAEPALPNIDRVQQRMMNYVDRFQESLKSIRGPEPTPEMFDDISVLAYGSPTPLKAVGQVVIVSQTLAQITCFDPSVAKDVQKAIQLSMDQLNPQMEDEGSGTIKVPLPRMSMELREQTAKQLKQKSEATKQRIRQVRRKAMDVVKQGKDGKLAGVSKDDAFASGKEIDALTERVTERLQKLVDDKMESIMAV